MNGLAVAMIVTGLGVAAFGAHSLWAPDASRTIPRITASLRLAAESMSGRLSRGGKRARRVREFDDAVVDWMDAMYVAASSGLNLPDALERTARTAEEPLGPVLRRCLARYAAGASLLGVLGEELQAQGDTSGEVAWLLADSVRDGLPLASALAELRGHVLRRRRAEIGARLKTLGIRITLVTVFFLFPPAFVLIVLPNILTFIGV